MVGTGSTNHYWLILGCVALSSGSPGTVSGAFDVEEVSEMNTTVTIESGVSRCAIRVNNAVLNFSPPKSFRRNKETP